MKFFLSTLLFLSCSKAMHIEEESPSLAKLKAKVTSALTKLTVPQSSHALEGGLSQDVWGKILFEYCDDASLQKASRVSRTLYTVYLNQRKQGIEKIIDILENIKLSDWIAPARVPTLAYLDDKDGSAEPSSFDSKDPSVQDNVIQEQQKLETFFDINKADTPAFFETIMRYPHRLLYMPKEKLTPHVVGAHILTRIYEDSPHSAFSVTRYLSQTSDRGSKFQTRILFQEEEMCEECFGIDKLFFGINSQVQCDVFPVLTVSSTTINTRGWNIKWMKNLQQAPNFSCLKVDFFTALKTLPLHLKPQIKDLLVENFTKEELEEIASLGFSSLNSLKINNCHLEYDALFKILSPISSLSEIKVANFQRGNASPDFTFVAHFFKSPTEEWKVQFAKKQENASWKVEYAEKNSDGSWTKKLGNQNFLTYFLAIGLRQS